MHGNVEFRILGPVELRRHGKQCDLPPGRASGVLAILLLCPGTTVPAETLIDRLWDSRPPAKARENLSAYVTRLRASLRRASGNTVKLSRRASGHVLEADPETVDLHQFRRIRRDAGALASDRPGDAARLLRDADALWAGQPLAGLRGDWFARMRDTLEEERRAAIVDRVAHELALGRYSDLVGELGGLLAEYPSDEALVACLMTALYHSGRTSDALTLYRETRARMVEEQGTEPGPALAELHEQILRRDPGLAARSARAIAAEAPPHDPPPPTADELPSLDGKLGPSNGEDAGASENAAIDAPTGESKAPSSSPGGSGQAAGAQVLRGRLPVGVRFTATGFPPSTLSPDAVRGAGSQVAALSDVTSQAHRESAAAFDRSYAELEPSRQRFLRALSLHPGPTISPYSAAALTDIPLTRLRASWPL